MRIKREPGDIARREAQRRCRIAESQGEFLPAIGPAFGKEGTSVADERVRDRTRCRKQRVRFRSGCVGSAYSCAYSCASEETGMCISSSNSSSSDGTQKLSQISAPGTRGIVLEIVNGSV